MPGGALASDMFIVLTSPAALRGQLRHADIRRLPAYRGVMDLRQLDPDNDSHLRNSTDVGYQL